MNQKAHTIKKLFSRETSVATVINVSPEKIWQILTNVSGHKNWNSAIVSLEGEIKAGGQVKLVSALDPKRTIKLRIKAFEQNKKLVLGNMMVNRTHLLQKDGKKTLFTMTEKVSGPFFFPLFAKMIPSFDESFNTFVKDLKTEAEK